MGVVLLYMVAGGLAVGVVYSAVKLWGDAAAGRHGLGLLGLLGALVLLAALLGLGLQ